ncbi:MAG: hypothetical protein ACRCWD_00925, partial [Culicoidibacterales bacterium]
IDFEGIIFMSTRFANLTFALAMEKISPDTLVESIKIENYDELNQKKFDQAIEKGRIMYDRK